jgi:Nidogen-like
MKRFVVVVTVWVMGLVGMLGAVVLPASSASALVPDAVPLPAVAAGMPGGFVSLTPSRLLDTRSGVGAARVPVGARSTVHLRVTGAGGVPVSGVSAVVLNVTVTAPTMPGFVTVYGDGPTRPGASNLNFVAGQTVPNLVIAPVGASGKVDLYNGSAGTVQLIADVSGYYLSGTTTVAGAFESRTPSRLLDTRTGMGAPNAAVAAGGTVHLKIAGRGGVPAAGVSAVVLNVTVTAPTKPGFVTVFGDGSSRPGASNLNFVAGQSVPNLVIAPVGANGMVALYNGSAGTVQLIADVSGYTLSGGPTEEGAFGALAPSRLLDTRKGVGALKAAVGPGGTVALTVTGRGGVPAAGVSAVVLNVTVTAPSRPGYVTVFGDGTTRPSASNLNFVPGQTVPNLVIAPVGANGKVALYNGSGGTNQLIADVAGYYLSATSPLTVATTTLKDGVAGLVYQETLAGTGGVPPYSWTATGVPVGLAVSPDGVLSGTPTGTGTSQLRLILTDATHAVSATTLSLTVPTAVPLECSGQSCADLKPDGQTVQIPATRIGAITFAADGSATQVLLTGPMPTIGQILVLAPTADAPTGLIVVVNAVSPNDDGTSLLDVSPAGPADAYAEGTVQAIGAPVTSASVAAATTSKTQRSGGLSSPRVTSKTSKPSAMPGAAATPASELKCDNSASSELHGLSVDPTLTPTFAALWKHPIFGGGGVYVGTGGLSLFQIDLDGDITVNVGVSVSGASHCVLTLPSLTDAVPAGNLGAVIVRLEPSVDLTVSGKVDVRTSVTLHCGVEYRWDQGQESRVDYCHQKVQPLQLSSDSGVDVTAAGTLKASVSINGIAGVTGAITPAVHAGFTPAQHPIAEIDAKATFDLGVCLACLWSGSPAHASIVSGTIFDKVVASYDTTPSTVPTTTAPVITTASLPPATVGQPYVARLTTADNRQGTWTIASGALPDGLALDGDTISGRPTTEGTSMFEVAFTDTGGRLASRAYTLLVGLVATAGGSGAIQNLDYCRQNSLDRNDDNSTETLALPFSLNFYGSSYSSAYVSNNGYIRLDSAAGDYTPFPLVDSSSAIIAPFFADVDTRNTASALVTYGASPDSKVFCVNWVGVGYYNDHIDKVSSFQLLLVDRQDVAAGDFDIVFNYGPLNWETGDASGGTGGIGGSSARAGYSAGTALPGTSYELPGSGVSGALIDGGTSPLGASSQGPNGSPGRYTFQIRN